MTVNISKRLLGIACIFAAVFLPIILGMLTLLPTGFDPLETARFIHLTHPMLLPLILGMLTLLPTGFDPLETTRFIQFTTPLLLTVMAINVLVNVREPSEARGRGGTSLEQLPRNAATLLTGAVGMLLLFIYLVKATSSASGVSPTAAFFVYALTSIELPEEAWREISVAEGSQGPRSYMFSAQRVRPTSRRKPGEIHWGS